MLALEALAEQRIARAVAGGELEHLPGSGRPLELDDDTHVPPALRLAWRVLKNAGFVPEEVTLRGEIASLEGLIAGADTPAPEHARARRRLDLLRARLAASGSHEPNLLLRERYRGRLLGRLSRGG